MVSCQNYREWCIRTKFQLARVYEIREGNGYNIKSEFNRELPELVVRSSAKLPDFPPILIDLCVFCCHVLYIPVADAFIFAPPSVLI
jgi:hypothetical protein